MKKILFLLLTFSNAAVAQLPDKAKIDQYFNRLDEKSKAMGNIVLVKDGKLVYSRSIGYSQINATEKKPLTMENRFRIGSITKMFTTAMIFQLIEEGKLNPDDTLNKFLPQVPNASKITIMHMLGHRSGIPNVKRAEDSKTLPITKDEMIALIANAKPDFEPGTKHGYSNSAYQVLGLILEKVTGRSYGENLEKRITSGLGLKDTYMATGNIDVSKKEALTYMNFGGEWKQGPETHPSILFSAGAIISTPKDLATFIKALFDGKIVSKENLALMKTMKEGEGLGMEPFTFGGKTFYGHTGGADNYGAWLAYEPEEKLALAYTTNAKVTPVGGIMNGVMDIYYGKPFEIPTFEAFAVSTDVLDQYVGVYTIPGAPVKFTITRKGPTLFIQPPNESSAAPLEATAENIFRIEGAIVLEFDVAKKQMTLKRNGGQRVFTKEN